MIVEKSIEQLMEDLNGYVTLKDYLVEHVGNWAEERKSGKGNFYGASDSTFDGISETVLTRLLEKYCSRYQSWVVDVFEEALANSVGHGNNCDPFVITSVKVIECKEGYIIRIRDSGKGFDPFEVVRKRDAGEHGSFMYLGEGFNIFRKINSSISFENNGTVFNMVVYK